MTLFSTPKRPSEGPTRSEDPMRIVRQYEPLAWKVARSFTETDADAEDLFQELCITLWSVRGSVPEEVKELTFVYRIVLNRATSWKRQQTTYLRHLQLLLRQATTTGEVHPPQHDPRLALLYGSIRRLSESDRSLVLMQLEGRSYAEMSEVLGLSETVVGKRLSRARTKLGEMIQRENHDDT